MRTLPLPRATAGLAAVLIAAALANAQQREPDDGAARREDSYTQNQDAALTKAGYRRLGPFPWADRHDTRRIEEDLGRIPLRWVETAHFKIGSSLPERALPRDKAVRRRIGAELVRLRQKLPTVKPGIRKLDPWLRLHLYAQRMEELYAELQQLCGVTDASFPPAGEPVGGKAMGRGPYLGVRGKFLLLLTEKRSSCGRYLGTFVKSGFDQPTRWYFEETDCFLFATAEGYGDNAFKDLTALHCHVVFNVTHNLIDAFKGYDYVVPAWWKEGLAQHFQRRISAQWNNYSGIADQGARIYQAEDWDARVKARLGHGLVAPLSAHLDALDCDGFTLVDQMAMWSRIEFLLTLGHDKLAVFVDRMKGNVDENGIPIERGALLARQADAIRLAWGVDADSLDALWRQHALKQ